MSGGGREEGEGGSGEGEGGGGGRGKEVGKRRVEEGEWRMVGGGGMGW